MMAICIYIAPNPQGPGSGSKLTGIYMYVCIYIHVYVMFI